MGKILANAATHKSLISKISKQFIQLKPEKQMTQEKNGPKNQTDISPKKTYRWLQTHEKMLNITHYQRNANQNHNEVPSHNGQNGCYPKVYKQ